MGTTMTPDDPRHGTVNGYRNLHCHCDKCRDAVRRDQADYLLRHPEQVTKKAARMRALRARLKGDIGGPADACDAPGPGQLKQGADS